MLGGCPRVRGPQILGRHLFEQGVLDHFLVEEIGELERAHREQLDGLLQRWRQNQLLKELGMKFLLQHEAMVNEVVLKSGHVSVDVARHSASGEQRQISGVRSNTTVWARRLGVAILLANSQESE